MVIKDFEYTWYIYIGNKLKENSCHGTLKLKDAEITLYQWRVPKELRHKVICELEKLNIITKVNKKIIRFN